MLRSLEEDVRNLVAQGIPRPDLLIVTGDIAFSGGSLDAEEYVKAGNWLGAIRTAARIDPERTFIVPGNHDVQRNAFSDDLDAARFFKLLRVHDPEESIDAALERPADTGRLQARFRNYIAFLQGFAPECAAASEQYPASLFWSKVVSGKEGLKVRLVGLNTALLSHDDSDRGRLALGEAQLASCLLEESMERSDLVIVLSHHPFDWLRDGEAAREIVEANAHIHLYGHVHEAQSHSFRSGGGKHVIRVVAGAVHGEATDTVGHGYSLGAIVLEEPDRLHVQIWPRKWSKKNRDFRVDIDNVKPPLEYAQHELDLGFKPPVGTEPVLLRDLARQAIAGDLDVAGLAKRDSRALVFRPASTQPIAQLIFSALTENRTKKHSRESLARRMEENNRESESTDGSSWFGADCWVTWIPNGSHNLVAGRGDKCDVRLTPDSEVSRDHLTLSQQAFGGETPETWLIEDRNSTNGTYVGSKKLEAGDKHAVHLERDLSHPSRPTEIAIGTTVARLTDPETFVAHFNDVIEVTRKELEEERRGRRTSRELVTRRANRVALAFSNAVHLGPDARKAIAKICRRAGAGDPTGTETIRKLVSLVQEGPGSRIRSEAAACLGVLGCDSEVMKVIASVLPPLIFALGTQDTQLQVTAIRGLGGMGVRALPALEMIESLATSSSSERMRQLADMAASRIRSSEPPRGTFGFFRP